MTPVAKARARAKATQANLDRLSSRAAIALRGHISSEVRRVLRDATSLEHLERLIDGIDSSSILAELASMSDEAARIGNKSAHQDIDAT